MITQGYKHQKAYIIAEGPMATTVRNMIKILYDRKCGAIVMLSNFFVAMQHTQHMVVQ